MKNKGIVFYLFITFGLAWISWEIPLQTGISPRSLLFQLWALPGAFAPAVAALIVRKWVTREGFADAGFRLNLRKWPYYLFAWFWPLAVIFFIILLAVAFRVGLPNFSFLHSILALAPGKSIPPAWASNLWFIVPAQLLASAVISTPLLWGEEFGWRSYLQIRLFSQNPLLAAVTTGLIWGIWHLPLNLRGFNFPGHPILGLFLFPVGTILLSIIFGWIRLQTRSIWPVSLAHAATNTVGASLTEILFAGNSDRIWVGYLGILSWIPLGCFCAWIVASGRLKMEERK